MLLPAVSLSLVVLITLAFVAIGFNAIGLSCGVHFMLNASIRPAEKIKDIPDHPLKLVAIIRIDRKDPNNNDGLDIEFN